MQEAEVVRSLAALAQEVRLRVFRALVVAGAGGLTPSALAEQLAVAPNALSFHLRAHPCGADQPGKRQGRNSIYRASFATMNELLGYLTDNCRSACLSPDALAAIADLERRACCAAVQARWRRLFA
ncbi:MAG: helix-turn-helix domain-containing protein [Burkholderiaceae bacterium]